MLHGALLIPLIVGGGRGGPSGGGGPCGGFYMVSLADSSSVGKDGAGLEDSIGHAEESRAAAREITPKHDMPAPAHLRDKADVVLSILSPKKPEKKPKPDSPKQRVVKKEAKTKALSEAKPKSSSKQKAALQPKGDLTKTASNEKGLPGSGISGVVNGSGFGGGGSGKGPGVGPGSGEGPPGLGKGDGAGPGLWGGAVTRPPSLIQRIKPPYPRLARRKGIQGKVRVRFLVDRNGRVQQVEIIASYPPDVFDDAVRRTLPSWRFSPGLDQGRAIDAWVITVVRFQLEG